MDRINGAGHVDHMFVAEDVPTLRPPTEITEDWLNSVQEEIAKFPEARGVALDPANRGQMYEAVVAMIAEAIAAGVSWAAIDQIVTAAGMVVDHTNAAQPLEAIQRLIDAQSGNYALDTGAANAYVVALDPAIAAYGDGMTVRVKAINANTGASTLNAGAGAVALVNDVGGALVDGDVPAGSVFAATYIASVNKFYITSLVSSQALTQTEADTLYAPIGSEIDYETGTFTPGASDQSGNPFPSYQAQSGTYTRIGNRVHISLYFRTLGSTAGMTTTQGLRITGLPFAAGNSFTLPYAHCMANVTALSPATYLGLMARGQVGATYLNVHAVGGDGSSPYSPTPFTVANFEQGSGAEFHIETTYQI